MKNKKILIVSSIIIFLTVFIALVTLCYKLLSTTQNNTLDTNSVSYPVISTFMPSSYTISSNDITQSLGQILITPDLRAEFYNLITADYILTQESECVSKLTNTNFPDLKLSFNSCDWNFDINQNTDTKLIADLPEYFQQSIIFTSKSSGNAVKINLEYPFFWEGTPDDVCTTDLNKIQRVTDTIYRIDNLESLRTAYGTEYISRAHIIMIGDEDYNSTLEYYSFVNPIASFTQGNLTDFYCINQGSYIPVQTQFRDQAVKTYNKMSNLILGRGIIGGIRLNNHNSEFVDEADNLIKGFEF